MGALALTTGGSILPKRGNRRRCGTYRHTNPRIEPKDREK
jgi:hypothetical protein